MTIEAAFAHPDEPLPTEPALTAGLAESPSAQWLTQHEGKTLSAAELFGGLCERLVQEGVPLLRASCGLPTMHPQIYARGLIWARGEGHREIPREHGIVSSAAFRDSPVAVIQAGAAAVRRRLDVAEPQLDFPILHELKEAGASDYVAMPLRFTSGHVSFISWTTDAPGGFTTQALTLLWELLPLIALRFEIESAYRMADDLLATYLGQNAARRVRSGAVRVGQGEVIRAAIWYCDLRGFTSMADRMPAQDVIAILDAYFECMARAVQSQGGEVLKFVGDAMLAIFEIPPGPVPEADNAACRALSAALAAREALAELNEQRDKLGSDPLEIGIALHVGDVIYGNIGAADRLDFTVIGPAVNEVCRMETLCGQLGHPILTSQSFQEIACDPRLETIGWHGLRGVATERQLFALPSGPLVQFA